ncbi:MFS transporter [Scopulibacillus cellulosilyticus]|uniref:MFS transporter n=1 Tax=Scopulibacillus cellulosilyticus TaxID=2665665 RepID=A0ABW2PTZ7_9BACL
MARSNRMFYERELTIYPIGGRRIWLLFIVILANFIANYEAQIAPVVPMLLKDLRIELTQYGMISAVSTIAAALSALIFGPIADRHGRVRYLVPSLFLTAICVYGMTLVHSVFGLLAVRVLLGLVEGISISTTAGLVRDFSPRMGRALAYGFWTFGPVGSNFFANGLAGWTLPVLHTWQSQFVIQGTIAFVSAILILFFIYDLSPKLRAQVITNNQQAESINKALKGRTEDNENQKMREITRIPRIWTLSIGISLFLVTYLTVQAFGPTILVQGFGYGHSQAAEIAKYFWLLNLATLLVAGWISDRLKLRKVVSLTGAVLSFIYMIYFATLFGQDIPEGQMIIYTSLLGGLMGICYGPWMALFSENAEDIKASLQSAAWGLWGFVIRVIAVVILIIAPVVVAMHGWGAWMWISAISALIYVPLVFTARGPWFRRTQVEEEVVPPDVTT